MKFGEIKKVNIRDVWPKEDRDFTPWLAENIEALGEAIGMDLELVDSEVAVGAFSLDLLAKDLGTGHSVIIENQFSKTDHDHLGKLITYAGGYGASSIVWVSEYIRDEHRQALDWLNQRTGEDTFFFGVEITVIQIDDSKPAYSFTPVVSPSEWQKSKKKQTSVESSERGEKYRTYFQKLIDILREKHHFTKARKGQTQNWYSFTSGFSGVSYGAVFAQKDKARTELYIDPGDAVQNKKLFDWMLSKREEIELNLSLAIEWESLDSRRASRISLYREGSIMGNETNLDEILEWHVENLLNFKKVFNPILKEYFKSTN